MKNIKYFIFLILLTSCSTVKYNRDYVNYKSYYTNDKDTIKTSINFKNDSICIKTTKGKYFSQIDTLKWYRRGIKIFIEQYKFMYPNFLQIKESISDTFGLILKTENKFRKDYSKIYDFIDYDNWLDQKRLNYFFLRNVNGIELKNFNSSNKYNFTYFLDKSVIDSTLNIIIELNKSQYGSKDTSLINSKLHFNYHLKNLNSNKFTIVYNWGVPINLLMMDEFFVYKDYLLGDMTYVLNYKLNDTIINKFDRNFYKYELEF